MDGTYHTIFNSGHHAVKVKDEPVPLPYVEHIPGGPPQIFTVSSDSEPSSGSSGSSSRSSATFYKRPRSPSPDPVNAIVDARAPAPKDPIYPKDLPAIKKACQETIRQAERAIAPPAAEAIPGLPYIPPKPAADPRLADNINHKPAPYAIAIQGTEGHYTAWLALDELEAALSGALHLITSARNAAAFHPAVVYPCVVPFART